MFLKCVKRDKQAMTLLQGSDVFMEINRQREALFYPSMCLFRVVHQRLSNPGCVSGTAAEVELDRAFQAHVQEKPSSLEPLQEPLLRAGRLSSAFYQRFCFTGYKKGLTEVALPTGEVWKLHKL